MSGHENWREMFKKIEFYKLDIRLLRELGHDVVLSGGPGSIDWRADLYYCWWWGHAPHPLLVAKLRRKPLVVTGAFDYSTCREELPGLCYLDRPAWQRAVLRSVLRQADANLFISFAEYEEVTANLAVHNPFPAPLAVDTQFYRADGVRTAISDYFFSVALSSRTNSIRKGLPQTIAAFARIADHFPSTRLVLAGKQGDHVPVLCALAETLDVADRVEFLGLISDEEKLHRYRECIAYVQPTLYEAFGHAIAEAIATGSRVVSSNRGAVPEVAGRFAITVDPHDIDAIASAMAACVEAPRSSAETEAAHRWIAENYSLNTRRARLDQILSSVS